jgi:hypothetical protein
VGKFEQVKKKEKKTFKKKKRKKKHLELRTIPSEKK